MTATRPDLRVGDAERDTTATSLREHYAQGRLSTDELNERLDAAFSATTQGQLEQVTYDLPHIPPAPSAPAPAAAHPPRRGRGLSRGAARALGMLAVLAALVVVASVAQRGGHHGPRNILALVFLLLILRGLLFRAFGQRRGHHDHSAHYSSHEDDGLDDRGHDHRARNRSGHDDAGRPWHEHRHEHHRSANGHGYSYDYKYKSPGQPR